MKVGVLQFFGWRDRSVPLEDVYARALDRIDAMDRSGYDAVWLADLHDKLLAKGRNHLDVAKFYNFMAQIYLNQNKLESLLESYQMAF